MHFPYQAHLVCQDAILVNVPVVAQPVHAIDLERHELESRILSEVRLGIEGELLLLQPIILVFSQNLRLTPGRNSDRTRENETLKSRLKSRVSRIICTGN